MARLRTNLAEAEGAPVSDWTPPPGALRQVQIHLTPFAPGLADAGLSDPERWRFMGWVTPRQIVTRLLRRLDRRADQVSLRAIEGMDGVEVHDGPPPHVGCEHMLAIIFDVRAAAIRVAWAALMPSAEVERHVLEGATILAFKPRDTQQSEAA